MKAKITVTVDAQGMAKIEHVGLGPLETSIVLSQVIVQLQVQAAQQSGSTILSTPAALPAGIRLS